MQRVKAFSQMFFLKRDGRLMMLLAKIVHDILATGNPNVVCKVLDGFHDKFSFWHSPS